MRYVRTCQECGHQQKSKDPATYKNMTTEAWRDVKCRNCGSEGSLDYGSWVPETAEEIAEQKRVDQMFENGLEDM